MLLISDKKNNKVDVSINDDSAIPVQKVYKYRQLYHTKNGRKSCIHTIIAPPYEKQIPNHIHYLNETLNSLVLSGIQLNKIRRILHTVIRCEVYGKSNMMNQVNKAMNKGELSLDVEKLMKLVFKKEGKVATNMRKTLTFCLEVVEKEENELKRIDNELKKLDKGDFD